ncbi:MAG: homoserine kinase [Actinomycetes bacterium]
MRVPASSANLGPGFDGIAMALSLYATVREAESSDAVADEFHPATIAFRALGGVGNISVRTDIPMGRGLGYSGAVRVGGALLAALQQDGKALLSREWRKKVLVATADLEGHGDNVAASLLGGVVGTNGTFAASITNNCAVEVVVWVPSSSTSTHASRTKLPSEVLLADAAFNIAHTALLVGALNSGDLEALAVATADRLHQDIRFAAVPESKAALDAGLSAGAICGWLSGSGPSVAMFCPAGESARIAHSLPAQGSAKVLEIDTIGARLL